MGINWIKNDRKYRQFFLNTEVKKKVLKSLLYNKENKYILKLYYDKSFKNISKSTSIAKCRVNCLILNNCRSVFRRFKLSRHAAKKLGSHGFLVGLKKSSF